MVFTWTKMMSFVAVALGCGMTIGATNARAEEETDVTAESVEAVVNVNDDDFESDDDEDTERRGEFDRDGHGRGYRACYSSCDAQRNSCKRGDHRGYEDGRRGDRRRGNYRRCERRFDFCIEQCRDSRGHNR